MTEPRDTKDSKGPATPLEPAWSCPWPPKEPPDPDDMEWKRAVLDGSSGKNRNFLISFLLFQWYLILIVLGVTDFDLFVPDNRISLPLLNLEIPLFSFFIVSPPLLLAFHFNLLFNLQEHGKLVADWCERYKEPPKLSPFLFNYLFKLKKAERGFLLLPLVWSFLVYYIPLFTFVLVQWRFSDYHHQLMTSYHFAFVGLDFLLVLMYSRLWDLEFLKWEVRHRDRETGWRRFRAWVVAKVKRKTSSEPNTPIKPTARPWLSWIAYLRLVFSCLVVLSAGVNYQAFQGIVDGSLVQRYNLYRNGKGEIYGVGCNTQPGVSWMILGLFCGEDPSKKQDEDLKQASFLPSREFLFSILIPVMDLHEQDLVRKKPDDSLVARYTHDLKKDKLDALLEFGQGYNLQGRDLELSNLMGANLLKVDFRGANLKEIYSELALLQGADLENALLKEADFSGADLQKANLSWTELHGAVFHQAQLAETDFTAAVLYGADLTDATMDHTVLTGSELNGADLSWATLRNTKISFTDFEGVDVTGTNLIGLDPPLDWFQASFGEAIIEAEADREKKTEAILFNPGGIEEFSRARKALLCLKQNFEFIATAKGVFYVYESKRKYSRHIKTYYPNQTQVLRLMYQDPTCRPRLKAIRDAKLETKNNWLQKELSKPQYKFDPE